MELTKTQIKNLKKLYNQNFIFGAAFFQLDLDKSLWNNAWIHWSSWTRADGLCAC